VLVDTLALAVGERVGGWVCACAWASRQVTMVMAQHPEHSEAMRVRCDIYDLSITISRERAREIKKERKWTMRIWVWKKNVKEKRVWKNWTVYRDLDLYHLNIFYVENSCAA